MLGLKLLAAQPCPGHQQGAQRLFDHCMVTHGSTSQWCKWDSRAGRPARQRKPHCVALAVRALPQETHTLCKGQARLFEPRTGEAARAPHHSAQAYSVLARYTDEGPAIHTDQGRCCPEAL